MKRGAIIIFCQLSQLGTHDVDGGTGPTTFLPKSAVEEYQAEIAVGQEDWYVEGLRRSDLLEGLEKILVTLGAGDCSIYNPMMPHYGGASR